MSENTFMRVCPVDLDGDPATPPIYDYPIGYTEASTVCANPVEITWPMIPISVWTIDTTLTPYVTDSVDWWNDALDEQFLEITASEGNATVLWSPGGQHVGEAWHQLDADGTLYAWVSIHYVGDAQSIRSVIKHELGHVLGLAHDGWDASIMHGQLDLDLMSSPEPAIEMVTDADRTALRAKYATP